MCGRALLGSLIASTSKYRARGCVAQRAPRSRRARIAGRYHEQSSTRTRRSFPSPRPPATRGRRRCRRPRRPQTASASPGNLGDAREGRGNVRGERSDAQGCALMMCERGALGIETAFRDGRRIAAQVFSREIRGNQSRGVTPSVADEPRLAALRSAHTMAAAALDEYDLAIYPGSTGARWLGGATRTGRARRWLARAGPRARRSSRC